MFKEPRSSLPRYFIDKRLELQASQLHGTGVFAKEEIEEHTLIESSPVILFHRQTTRELKEVLGKRHILSDYVFRWPEGMQAIALGFGSLYNHSTNDACVSYRVREDNEAIEFITQRKISAGEELLIRYVAKEDYDKLWFVDDEAPDTSLRRPGDRDPQNPGIMSSWDSFRK